jgi:hypothetical protein
MLSLRSSLAAIVVVFSLSAHANQPLDIDKVVTQQRELRADLMAGSGRYKQMPASKRQQILKKQDELLRMLEGKETSDDLSADQRMAAFNSLEWIEAAINDEKGERMICRRERTIGSNRVTRICRTEAQMAAERERARDELDRGDMPVNR